MQVFNEGESSATDTKSAVSLATWQAKVLLRGWYLLRQYCPAEISGYF